MPLHTPLIKVSSTRSHGANVVLHGNNYDEAFEGALRRGDEANLTFIHAFDDRTSSRVRERSGSKCSRKGPTWMRCLCLSAEED